MERRRLLDNDGYIDWLKSLTCQFYAPLDSDLKDYMSGQVGVSQNNNTVVWDDNESAYLFTKDTSTSPYGQSVVRLSGLNMQYDINNIGYSILFEIKVIQWPLNNSNQRVVGGIVPLVLGGRTVAFNIQNCVTQLNVWNKVALIFPKNEGVTRYSYKYCDGILTDSYNRGTTVYVGNNLTNTEMDTNKMPSSYTKMGTDCKYYMRNAMAFTDALNIDTIRKIQKII